MQRTVLGLFLAFLVIYHVNGKPHPEVDCVAAPYTAWSLVRHGSLDISGYAEPMRLLGNHVVALPDGSAVSMRPPGSALAAVPFVAPFAIWQEQPPEKLVHVLGKLAAACSVAGGATLFFLACRRLTGAAAWPATILLALGTCLFSMASQSLWMHGPATFWLCAALYCLTREDCDSVSWASLAGLALGLATITRPTTAFFAIATGITLLAQRRWRATAWLTLGGALPVAGLCLLNWSLFGSPFLGGYVNDNWHDAPPWWIGFGGLLIAPSRGMLVYTPALVLVPLGAWQLLRAGDASERPARALVLTWLAAAVATYAFYARWHDWRGGWSYGPRFLCEAMPAMCLAFAVAYRALQSAWQRRLAGGLVALSVAIHVVGVFGYSGYEAWQWRHDRPDDGRCLFELQDTQIEAHARALVRKLTGAGKDDALSRDTQERQRGLTATRNEERGIEN